MAEKRLFTDETGNKIVKMLGLMVGKNLDATQDLHEIHKIVQGGLAPEIFSIGDQLNIPWSDGTDQYVVPMDVVNFEEVTLSDGEKVPGMILQWHYCSPFGVQFDQNEALYYAENGLAAGTYHFKCGNGWGTNIVANKSYQFTLTKEVPAGGQIQIGTATSEVGACPDKNPSEWRIRTYSSNTTAETIEIVSLTEGTDGTDLGVWSSSQKFSTGGLNNMQRSSYGYNRWSQSALRQYLNSKEDKAAWWKPQNVFDRPPAELASRRGFLAGFDEDFLSILKPIKITTALNTLSDQDLGTTEDTYDTFFLPSKRNMNLQEQLANVEGNVWDYWFRATDGQKPENYKEYAAPITYAINAKTSAQLVRLRSAYRGNANLTWCVSSYGNVSNNLATSSHRFAPACAIC